MLETLVVHDQHYQVNAFDSNLQPPTSASNRNERRLAPASSRAASGQATPVLATEDETTLNQVWHYEDALCVAQHLFRDAFVWSRHDGMQNIDGRLQACHRILARRARPCISSNQAYQAHQQH